MPSKSSTIDFKDFVSGSGDEEVVMKAWQPMCPNECMYATAPILQVVLENGYVNYWGVCGDKKKLSLHECSRLPPL